MRASVGRVYSEETVREREAEARRAALLTQTFTCPVPNCGGTVEVAHDWSPGGTRPYCRTCAARAGQAHALPEAIAERDRTIAQLRRRLVAAEAQLRRVETRTAAELARASGTPTPPRRSSIPKYDGRRFSPTADAVVAFVAAQGVPVRLPQILAGVRTGTPQSVQKAVSNLARAGKLLARRLPPGNGKGRPMEYEVAPE